MTNKGRAGQVDKVIARFNELSDEHKAIFIRASEKILKEYKSKDSYTLSERIDKAITLFELWQMRTEEKEHLSYIARAMYLMEYQAVEEKELEEFIGFVGALWVLNQF